MNKLIAAIIGVIIVIGAGTAIVITRGSDDNTARTTNTATGQSQEVSTGEAAIVAVDACDVLTLAAAQAVLGNDLEKGDTSAGNVSTDDVSVTNCVYSTKAASTGTIQERLASNKNVGVLARSGKTKAGADSNKAPFTSAKPAGVEDISGYGDQAYFNPKTGQVNILKGGNWYILTYKAGTGATQSTLAELKPLADAIKANIK